MINDAKQAINVIVLRNGVPDQVITLLADQHGLNDAGEYVPEKAEALFLQKCREVNPNLPIMNADTSDEDMADCPSLDDGCYEHQNMNVYLVHSHEIM